MTLALWLASLLAQAPACPPLPAGFAAQVGTDFTPAQHAQAEKFTKFRDAFSRRAVSRPPNCPPPHPPRRSDAQKGPHSCSFFFTLLEHHSLIDWDRDLKRPPSVGKALLTGSLHAGR